MLCHNTVPFLPHITRTCHHAHHPCFRYQYQLKGISFLPRVAAGAYPQMPYEAIGQETYRRMVAAVRASSGDGPLAASGESPGKGGRVSLSSSVRGEGDHGVPDKFCDNDSCRTI